MPRPAKGNTPCKNAGVALPSRRRLSSRVSTVSGALCEAGEYSDMLSALPFNVQVFRYSGVQVFLFLSRFPESTKRTINIEGDDAVRGATVRNRCNIAGEHSLATPQG